MLLQEMIPFSLSRGGERQTALSLWLASAFSSAFLFFYGGDGGGGCFSLACKAWGEVLTIHSQPMFFFFFFFKVEVSLCALNPL